MSKLDTLNLPLTTPLVVVLQGEGLVVRPPPGEQHAALAQGDQDDLQAAQQVLAQVRALPDRLFQTHALKL